MKIHKLSLFTSNLSKQLSFYNQTLGFPIIYNQEDRGAVQIGNSTLEFIKKENSTPYHFALNIPSNQEKEALAWLKEKVEILRDGENELQDFDFWNAWAMYFYDEDQNIVEFIARKNLKNDSNASFSVKSLIGISEIGVPVSKIEPTFKELNRFTGIEIFDGSFERFCAVGDENGLFICINKDVKDWFPTDDKAYSSEFELELEESGKPYKLKFQNGQISTL